MQDFWKRLRYYYKDRRISYYACGEYGTLNERPHYHAIVFDCVDTDAYVEAWNFGSVHIGDVSSASISYVCGYVDKPSHVLSEDDDRVKEFSRMSKNLGVDYLTKDIVKYYKADLSRLYVTLPGGVKVAMPRYYRDKIFTDDEKKVISHYLYWSDKWSDDVRPTFDQVKHMFERYEAKYLLAARRRL